MTLMSYIAHRILFVVGGQCWPESERRWGTSSGLGNITFHLSLRKFDSNNDSDPQYWSHGVTGSLGLHLHYNELNVGFAGVAY